MDIILGLMLLLGPTIVWCMIYRAVLKWDD